MRTPGVLMEKWVVSDTKLGYFSVADEKGVGCGGATDKNPFLLFPIFWVFLDFGFMGMTHFGCKALFGFIPMPVFSNNHRCIAFFFSYGFAV